jgi:hypothetical protein
MEALHGIMSDCGIPMTAQQIETSSPNDHSDQGIAHTQVVRYSLTKIPGSRKRYVEKVLKVSFQNRFLVHAMDKEPDPLCRSMMRLECRWLGCVRGVNGFASMILEAVEWQT